MRARFVPSRRPFAWTTTLRSQRQRRALLHADFAAELELASSDDPESLLEQRQGRELLDRLLDELPLELRAVLVLSEIEQLPREEVADLLGLRPGTVASRLRRARAVLERSVRRLRARLRRQGDVT